MEVMNCAFGCAGGSGCENHQRRKIVVSIESARACRSACALRPALFAALSKIFQCRDQFLLVPDIFLELSAVGKSLRNERQFHIDLERNVGKLLPSHTKIDGNG